MLVECLTGPGPALRRLPRLAVLAMACMALGGCYYWQAMRGHMELMGQREPVADVLSDPGTAAKTREQLEFAQQAVDFAHAELALPDNGSYRQYADTGRPYLVWNVVAAPEWSLQPRTWCFPVAGCVSYRGYFAEADAREFAARRAADGDDVFVGGATAYSTLGKFADPLTNVMLRMPDYRLAGLIFHELAHQQLYIAGDSAFNESFASAVEQAGIRRWLRKRGDGDGLCRYERWLARRDAVREVLGRGRIQLEVVYAGTDNVDALAAGKSAAMDNIRADYQALRAVWAGPPYFDGWFGPALNNASLAALATYDQYVPAFAALLAQQGGNFPAFYAAAEVIGNNDGDARTAALEGLGRVAVSAPAPAENCLPAVAARPGRRPD